MIILKNGMMFAYFAYLKRIVFSNIVISNIFYIIKKINCYSNNGRSSTKIMMIKSNF